MGSCFSGDKSDQEQQQWSAADDGDHDQQQHPMLSSKKKQRYGGGGVGGDQQKQALSAMSSYNSSKGVGLGISMMMHQAGMLAGCAAPSSMGTLRDQIRKAKAEGRTVTVMNGCVYIDYQLKAQIPPGFSLES